MLFKIAFRNLLARPLRSLAVGGIIAFGAFLAVLGASFIDSMLGSLRASLTRSITGDLQVYSDTAKDEFSLFSSMFGGALKIGHLENFAKVKKALLALPEVKAVVPQGVNFAMVNPGNILDVKLDELRQAYRARPRDAAKVRDLVAHVRAIIESAHQNYLSNLLPSGLVNEEDKKKSDAAFANARSAGFWKGFDAAYEARIEKLENDIAPLIFENSQVYFSYIGTVPHQAAEAFPLIEVVRGSMVPEGQRGFLFNDYVYETQAKHLHARRLDTVHKGLTKEGKKLASSKSLQQLLASNAEQVDDVLAQLSPADAAALGKDLDALLPPGQAGLRERMKAFYSGMDDSNFEARHAFFYKSVAPRITLYNLKIGESFPLKAFTESGFANAVNMKIWGTFRFKNFENSPVAGNFNLMDLASFRDLYGFPTAERKAQTRLLEAEMKAASSDLELGRDEFESLFKKSKPKVVQGAGKLAPAAAKLARIRPDESASLSDSAMEDGPCLNAAVILKDPSKPARAIAAIEKASREQGLGLKVIDWEAASGLLGQLTRVFMVLLMGMVALIFLVGAFIIQNTMFMAAMERTTEIGTLRAIGAQRRFIMKMVFAEALTLSALFAGLGAALASALALYLGKAGIPAPSEQVTFLFSGERLFLTLKPPFVALALLATVLTSLLASAYPAWKANTITPLKAMQKD